MVIRALGWIAVSTKKQAEEDKDSLPNQERLFRAWCEENGADIVDILKVPGHSRDYIDIHDAASDMRAEHIDAFDKLISYWKTKSFDVLWCLDGDRFARTQTLHAYVSETTVVRNGARIYSHMDGWIDQHNVRMWIAMSGYKTAAFKDRKAIERESGMRKRISLGLNTNGRAPFTHRIVRADNGEAVRLEVNEDLRPMFDIMANMLIAGVGLGTIAQELMKMGFRHPRSGTILTGSHLWNILMSPYTWGHTSYHHAGKLGHWVYDDTLPVPEGVIIHRGRIPPVWVGEQAEQVKSALRKAQIKQARSTENTAAFAGLLVCDVCGYRMQPNVRGRYYYCYRQWQMTNPCTHRKAVRGTYIQEWLHTRLTEAMEAGGDISVLIGNDDPTQSIRAQLVGIQDNLSRKQRELSIMVSEIGRTESQAVRDVMRRNADELGTEIEDLQTRLRELAGTLVNNVAYNRQSQIRTLQDLRESGIDALWLKPPAEINAILRSLFGPFRLLAYQGEILAVAVVEPK